jgi:myo-inositol 2-dehydrogenase/D-chiro-inositol 1-dehydrogenase
MGQTGLQRGTTMAELWTRREIVLAAGAVGAAGVLPMAGLSRRHITRAGLKVGVIGCGGRGTGALVQTLRADPDAVLWSAADIFPERIDSCLKNSGEALGDPSRTALAPERRFVGFDAYQKVIESGADLVLLTSYPVFRPGHLRAAVEAGTHVFAEKPLAVDAPGVRSVLESAALAERKRLSVVVGFCWRYHDAMRAIFERLHAGDIGDITTVQTTYYSGTLPKHPRRPGWSDLEFQFRNWWHFTWISGDHVVEQAVHSIDRLAWAMRDINPARVICLGGRAARSGPEHGNVYDHFSAVYEYDDGRRAFHACRQIDGCPHDNSDYVYGTRGSATINGWAPTFTLRDPRGETVWQYPGRTDRDMYQNEIDELIASIRSGTPINDLRRGAMVTLMAIMARMSAYTGQTISWDQALNSQESLTPASLAWGEWATPEVAVPGRTKFR